MNDVVGEIMLAIGDEYLLTEQTIGAVRCALGSAPQGADCLLYTSDAADEL